MRWPGEPLVGAGLSLQVGTLRGTVDKDEDFSAYVAARAATLMRTGVLLGCSVHDAEDLVQATLTRCYQSWGRVQSAQDADAYVFRAMLNTHATRQRRMWRRERPTPAEQIPDAVADDETGERDLALSVLAAIGRLSYDHRVVVTLRYLADLSESQIAHVLSIPPGTVKSRLSRAQAHLGQDPGLLELQGDGGAHDG
jgi:RNA polymerase sigma-70 factor (sigma-E family)